MTVWERAVAALAARALDGGLLDSLREESLSALLPECTGRRGRRGGRGFTSGGGYDIIQRSHSRKDPVGPAWTTTVATKTALPSV